MSETDEKMTEADFAAADAAKRPERELKLLHQLKFQQVEIDNLRAKLRIADAALSGFGLIFADRDVSR